MRQPLVRPAPSYPPTKLLFIAGLHRTGTTMLEHWMASMFSLSYLRAPVSENEGQHLQDMYPQASRYGGPGRFAFAKEMSPPQPDVAAAGVIRDRLLRCWQSWRVGEEPVLLEKSPPNLTKIAWLRAVFPGARFVVLVRDPRAVSLATQKWSSQSVEDLMAHYDIAYRIALADFRENDCVIVRYEEFVADPFSATLGIGKALRICERPAAQEMMERFAATDDRNEKYIVDFPVSFGQQGIWTQLGYEF